MKKINTTMFSKTDNSSIEKLEKFKNTQRQR